VCAAAGALLAVATLSRTVAGVVLLPLLAAVVTGLGVARITNTADTSRIVRRRPHSSESRLHDSAPITAPARMLEAMICSQPDPV